ncbi:protein transport protein S31, partial [Rhizopus stolonifer]
LSQINKTAVFAWSPGQQAPPFIATGTAAGALDDSFSNASELELYKLDFSSSGVTSAGKIATTSRFNKLVWGNASSSNPYGVIAGGMENGELTLYDPSKILDGKSEEEAKIMANATHTGQIRGLDFNKFQHNLLASAGSNNEVYIWDLTNPNTPYTPGPKSQKADDITTVGWNGQVQHILATSSSTGQTVVWDLRNRKEVMTLAAPSMTAGRRSISSVVWHPDVATQLVTASEDDANPVVTLWDLRHAHSPEKVLAGHTKGILSLSWCRQDSDLLMSCGKDCKTFIWNPNSGECLGELASDTNWTFQTEWCPRNPDLLASASFDGKINVYSLQNSGSDAEDHPSSAAVLDTAHDDPFSAAMNASAAAASAANAFSLRHPPKWLRCPVGASFGFGGKLVTFNNKAGQAAKQAAATLPPGQAPASQTITRTAQIHAIVTDKEAVQRADELETALEQQSVEQLVQERVQQAKEKDDKESWEVIKTLLAEDAREQLMNYLGFKKSEVMAAVAKATADQKKEPPDEANATDNSASGLFGEDAGDDFFIQTTTSDPTTTTVAQLEEEQVDDG